MSLILFAVICRNCLLKLIRYGIATPSFVAAADAKQWKREGNACRFPALQNPDAAACCFSLVGIVSYACHYCIYTHLADMALIVFYEA